MSIGDWMKGKRGSAPAAAIRRPDELISAYDERGREVQIKRRDWVKGILEPGLEKAWNDPDSLYDTVVRGLRDDFLPQVASAAERLLEVDGQSERSCVIAGIVRMERGDLAGAEAILQRSLDTHGPSGVVLTNLAKVLAHRGDEARSIATLRRAVEQDPNQDNGLMWWASIAREKGGDAGYVAALEEMARIPGAWRPQLALAREKLAHEDRAAAVPLYEHVLSLAADQPDILAAVTGELGRAGALDDLVRLAAPRYRPEVHGPHAGMNIVRGLKELRRFPEALALVRRLQAMPWPPLSAALAEVEKELVASTLPRSEAAAPAIELISLDAPLWTRGLFEPSWLLPPRDEATPLVALFGLVDETRTGGAPQVQMPDDAGRLTRALPLYLCEAVGMRLRARALACLWIVRGQGPAVFRARPPREALESSLPASPSRRLVVAGGLVADGLRLDVWQAGESAAPASLDVKVPLADVAGLIAQAEEALVSALVARGILPATPPPFRRSPPAGVLGGYVSAIEQLFYQVLAANGIVKAESLWNERGFFETYVGLVEAWTDPPDSARLIGICGVLAARAYGSAVAEPYRKIVLRWVEEAPPASVLRKLAPAVFRRLGEPDKLEAWLRASAPSTDAAYSAWLERVKAAT